MMAMDAPRHHVSKCTRTAGGRLWRPSSAEPVPEPVHWPQQGRSAAGNSCTRGGASGLPQLAQRGRTTDSEACWPTPPVHGVQPWCETVLPPSPHPRPGGEAAAACVAGIQLGAPGALLPWVTPHLGTGRGGNAAAAAESSLMVSGPARGAHHLLCCCCRRCSASARCRPDSCSCNRASSAAPVVIAVLQQLPSPGAKLGAQASPDCCPSLCCSLLWWPRRGCIRGTSRQEPSLGGFFSHSRATPLCLRRQRWWPRRAASRA